MERQREDHDQGDHREFPPHERVVQPGQQLHAEHVDEAVDEHQRDRHDQAGPGEHEHAVRGLHQPRKVRIGVLRRGEHLDGGVTTAAAIQLVHPELKLANEPNE